MDNIFILRIFATLTVITDNRMYSADGWVKAWNPVNGSRICVLNGGYVHMLPIVSQGWLYCDILSSGSSYMCYTSRYTRGRDPNDVSNSVVKCISVNSLQCRGVVSIGGLIRSWDFSPEANIAKGKADEN